MLELTILAVPDCPHAQVLQERLAQVLAGRDGVRLRRRVVSSAAQAARLGMHGSPTLLVDGTDPFSAPGSVPALACRLYPGDGGRLDGAPTVPALRQALGQAGPSG
jgi:hypothetical protein